MNLKEFNKEITVAMKEKRKEDVILLREVKGLIDDLFKKEKLNTKEKDEPKEPTTEQIESCFKKASNLRKNTIIKQEADFEKKVNAGEINENNRVYLGQYKLKLTKEKEFFDKYLPKELTAEETENEIKELLKQNSEFKKGQLIGSLKKKHGNKMNARLASELIDKIIG